MKHFTLPAASLCSAMILAAAPGCSPIRTENEITVKPIQIDLNVNVKVDQALADALSEKNSQTKNSAMSPERAARRERFLARRPQIIEWKRLGAVGENNHGMLEMLQPPAESAAKSAMTDVLAAENTDRTALFQNIAKRENATVEFIIQRWTAKRAMESSPFGTMIQGPDGKWSKKQ